MEIKYPINKEFTKEERVCYDYGWRAAEIALESKIIGFINKLTQPTKNKASEPN